jgi:hypothetical protein
MRAACRIFKTSHTCADFKHSAKGAFSTVALSGVLTLIPWILHERTGQALFELSIHQEVIIRINALLAH